MIASYWRMLAALALLMEAYPSPQSTRSRLRWKICEGQLATVLMRER